MSSTNALITVDVKYITIFLGIPILIAGVIGGVLNISVFLSLKTFRQSSCAFFLTIMSFVNIGQLITSLFSRIMISGFNTDWNAISLPYCKFRNYCLQTCALVSYTCMCLATIDQFLATSLRPRWQQLLTIKRAHILCLSFGIFWLLHGIPTLIFFSPTFTIRTGTISCINTNTIYQIYSTYCYSLTFAGVLPVFITVLFGCLAFKNVRQIPYRTVPLVRRELDKQLTSMVLIQVVHNFIVIVPYISILVIAGTLNLPVTAPNYTSVVFTNFITGMIYYFYFASPFYIYVFVSKRFRQQLLYVLLRIFIRGQERPELFLNNQIVPKTSVLSKT